MSKLIVATTTGFLCFCSSAFSQEEVGLGFGSFKLIPTLNVTLGFNDNVTRSHQQQVDSWFSLTQPRMELVRNFGLNSMRVGYQLSRGNYFSSSADNYTDHLLFTSIAYELNSRNRLKAVAEFADGHDDRGTAYSIGAGNSLGAPDEFKQGEFDLLYSYGVLSAKARLDFNSNYRKVDYKLNTPDYLLRDREYTTAGATFFYDIGSATELLALTSFTDVSYKLTPVGGASLDSWESSLLVGATWQSSTATAGYVRVGYQSKDFDNQFRNDFSGLKWQAGIIWQPYQRATFELDTQSETQETNGEGNFIQSEDVSLAWRHHWLKRLNTRIAVAYANDSYEGDATGREDVINELSLALHYQFKRWLSFDIGYTFSERDSKQKSIDFVNQHNINYDQNVYTITGNISL